MAGISLCFLKLPSLSKRLGVLPPFRIPELPCAKVDSELPPARLSGRLPRTRLGPTIFYYGAASKVLVTTG